ncbi:MAG: hypothetical protein M3Q69_01560 [Acidobacteriota bacterium]|nr:hypothetical protein [Acidobacteriota bacterium]
MRLLPLLFIALLTLPALADELTVAYISRLPEIEYVWNSAHPETEGWPQAGQAITWRAHVRSWNATLYEAAYRWSIDGRTVARGRVILPPNTDTTVDLPATWSFERHRITFAIDTENVVAEESEKNNELTVFSDALSVGFWIEQPLYDYFREHQAELGIGSTSFEDYAQRTINYFNDMAALAVHPETPRGVLDRLRLQKIVIVPDGALPLSGFPPDVSPGASGETHPDKDDRTVDLMWGFTGNTFSRYTRTTEAVPSNDFYLGYYPLHEMGHARYLTDVYAWNVLTRSGAYAVDILENGRNIAGTYIPAAGYRTPEQGLMNAHYTFLDRYSAIALNLIAGRRAIEGNYNEPRNIASFLNDLPAQNRLTIRDQNGNPIPDADVWFFWSVANATSWYGTNYDHVPDIKLRTDANGQVLVGRSPFSASGKVVQTYGMTNGVAIVRVGKGDYVAYGFLESRLFNLAYWRGQTDFADHDLIVGRTCTAAGPILAGPQWDARTGSTATVEWQPMTGATNYRVIVSTNLHEPQVVATTTNTSATIHVSGQTYWWVEADLALCGTRRSAMGRLDAPQDPRRRAVRH